jgi:hypothetical protein
MPVLTAGGDVLRMHVADDRSMSLGEIDGRAKVLGLVHGPHGTRHFPCTDTLRGWAAGGFGMGSNLRSTDAPKVRTRGPRWWYISRTDRMRTVLRELRV